MKNLQKRKVRSKNKVRALFPQNKVRFARAKQLWFNKLNERDIPSCCCWCSDSVMRVGLFHQLLSPPAAVIDLRVHGRLSQ